PHARRGRTAPPPGRGQAPGGGARHPKKSHGVLRRPDELTFAWIEERKGQWPVAQLCLALGVSRSGFYAWRSREPSAAEVRREELTEEVAAIHAEVKGRYGSPRIHAELVGRGHVVLREHGRARHARGRDRGEDEAEVPPDDRLRPQLPGGRERAGPPVRSGRAQRLVGGGRDVHSDARGVGVPGGRRGPVQPDGGRLVDGSDDDQSI